ncbi:hypothetical protein F3Y22_tig00111877pilonHSYRG00308 [Hibiscus syriacus]|uniref:Uncharacterized protein n=1 Tax=Hibiscus syriacus TaxID=106335 RepID=A0A6A2XA53_HIBSY|nr:hypothetical protein F3Y22_tig00111877pilonHSYRG00308 [Hibiscus syriacus]
MQPPKQNTSNFALAGFVANKSASSSTAVATVELHLLPLTLLDSMSDIAVAPPSETAIHNFCGGSRIHTDHGRLRLQFNGKRMIAPITGRNHRYSTVICHIEKPTADLNGDLPLQVLLEEPSFSRPSAKFSC